MSDKVKLIIEIPKEIYIHFLSRYKYQDTSDIGLSECEKVGVAIKNGIPLDDVKQEIWITDFDFGDYYDHTADIQDKVIDILDNIGKESEESK